MGELPGERVTYDDDGHLDEVVTYGAAHLECMDCDGLGGTRWFLECTRADGTAISLWIEGRVRYQEERDAGGWFERNRKSCAECNGVGHVPAPPKE